MNNEENIDAELNITDCEYRDIMTAIQNNNLEFISNFRGQIPDRFNMIWSNPYQIANSVEMINLLMKKKC